MASYSRLWTGRSHRHLGEQRCHASPPALLEFPEELMQQSVNTNVWGTVRMMKAVLPHMIERNYGRIVSIGGTAFEAAVPYHTFLAGIGKGSVVGLTTTVAAEYGKWNITANCVSPAGMETRNDGTLDSVAGTARRLP